MENAREGHLNDSNSSDDLDHQEDHSNSKTTTPGALGELKTHFGRVNRSTTKSPRKVIREKCLDCNLTPNEVKLCPVTKCPLWEYRFGCRPETARRRHGDFMNPEFVKAYRSSGLEHVADD
jgi:hypothetical protein